MECLLIRVEQPYASYQAFTHDVRCHRFDRLAAKPRDSLVIDDLVADDSAVQQFRVEIWKVEAGRSIKVAQLLLAREYRGISWHSVQHGVFTVGGQERAQVVIVVRVELTLDDR